MRRKKARQMPDPGRKKMCSQCHMALPATPEYFTRRQTVPDGLNYACKECTNARRRNAWQKRPRHQVQKTQEDLSSGMKQCRTCSEIKSIEQFGTHGKLGRMSQCHLCWNAYIRDRYKNRPGPEQRQIKTCNTCDRSLPATRAFFTSNPRTPDHLEYRCKACANARRKAKHVMTEKPAPFPVDDVDYHAWLTSTCQDSAPDFVMPSNWQAPPIRRKKTPPDHPA